MRHVPVGGVEDRKRTGRACRVTQNLFQTSVAQVLRNNEAICRAAATPKAIRLYESMGLLGRVARMGAYRVYSDRHVTQVRLIKQAQAMGFKLADVVPSVGGQRTEPDWAAMAEQVDLRRAEIAREILRLKALGARLREFNKEIRACAERA